MADPMPEPAAAPTAPPTTASGPDVHLPNRHDVWRQVRSDLFETKDVQNNPTFSYTWIADQGGHFSLGFLPTYLLSWLVGIVGGWLDFDTKGWNIWIGLVVFGVWVVKELNDFRIAWGTARRSKSDFPFNLRELLWNIVTAWLFFAMGSAVAAVSFLDDKIWAVLALVPVAVLTLRVSYWWLRRKITFQQAGLPYLYRLANFPNNIPVSPTVGLPRDVAVKFIKEVLEPGTQKKRHLILTGVPNAGKSTLAVAIGTEFVFKLRLCRFLTLVKLLQLSTTPPGEVAPREVAPREEFDDGRVLWRWDRVEMLIVDDVEDIARVGHEGPHSTPEQKDAYNKRVAEVLITQFGPILGKLQALPRTVWVCNDPINPEALKKLLVGVLKYAADDVQIISLEKTMEDAQRDKQLPVYPAKS